MNNNNKCKYCGFTIKKIGDRRKNGVGQNDWDGRKLHKKCIKKVFTIRNAYCLSIRNEEDRKLRRALRNKLIEFCDIYDIPTPEEELQMLNK